ncbi:MAG: dihydroneopterin aldolase [bacterium]|nr:dihydroneopterin aldolase [bacterium]
MDVLKLEGMRYRVRLGFLPEERYLGGEVRVNVSLFGDFQKAGNTDKIEDAVDYRKVVTIITEEVVHETFHLLETFAEKLAKHLLEALPQVQQVEVTVRKSQPPLPVILDGVEVTIRRKRP